MSPIIVARDVSFDLPNGRELFRRLNVSLDDSLTALVGHNGVGKTCLARLLVGDIAPSHGHVICNGSVRLLRQRELPPAISVASFLSGKYEWSPIGESLLQDIDRERPCTHLSGGEWMRVRLTHALSDDFLILDEPTNDLDRAARNAIVQFLRERRGGALLISHDRECLTLCQDVLELSNRGLVRFGGGWHEYTRASGRERERLEHVLDTAKRQREAAKLARVRQHVQQAKRNRRGAQASRRGGMPKILLGARKRQAQETTGRLDAAGIARANDAVRAAHQAFCELKTDPVMYADLLDCELPAQKLVAEADDFNVRFADWIYPKDLSFSWHGNVRIALRGGNGSGKSTLLRALLGHALTTRGTLLRGALRTAYVDQRLSFLNEDQNVLDNVRMVSRLGETELRNALARFLFAGDSVHMAVRHLSGGERLRAALAQTFLCQHRPELLVLDEPTNNLDLANIEFLEDVVSSFKGALIVVSHDEYFLERCGITEELML